MSNKIKVYHIPACPFSQRLEILLALKGQRDAVEFEVVDITKPRDPELLAKTRGTTALPVLETAQGDILKESLVILRYLDEVVGPTPVRQQNPLKHAVENMLIAHEGPLTITGYTMVMNQDPSQRQNYVDKMLDHYRTLNDFLAHHSPKGTFLFDEFGLAEAVYTPLFMRFWFLDYYEEFDIPQTELSPGCLNGAMPVWRMTQPSKSRAKRSSNSIMITPWAPAMALNQKAATCRALRLTQTGANARGRRKINIIIAPATKNWACTLRKSPAEHKNAKMMHRIECQKQNF